MAPPAGTIRPGRYLAIFLMVVALLYGLVFFTGDREPSPRLGIDLKGGTSVTLSARTPDGSPPGAEALDRARAIINQRVDGLGVAGAEVVLDGTQIVITVPGEEGEQAKTLGQTAKLGFRKVLAGPFRTGASAEEIEQETGEDETANGDEDEEGEGTEDGGDGGDEGDAEESDEESTGDNGGGGSPAGSRAQDDQDEDDIDAETRAEIEQARDVRQNEDILSDGPESAEAIQAALASLDCSAEARDPLVGNDDPELPLVACSQERIGDDDEAEQLAYVMGPVILPGERIADSSFGINQDGPGHEVRVEFDGEGTRLWAQITAEMAQESATRPPNDPARVAFVLDTEVVSAPSVTQTIQGNTRITGDFTQAEARDMAGILKYGSLPLSFQTEDAQTVSATLGLASLKAGLIAGAIGFALIVLYSVFYYRLLGVLLIASLGLTAALVFPIIILLGRSVGYTLDIAGVAGLIIAIGVTADSFVVYFERLKDEIRSGRTVRSAVPRAWVRARRTILSADGVVFMAAVVLYILALGHVKGFAFTIGLTTLLDLLVVFMVTHPLLVLAANWKILGNRRLSGLGMVQDAGRIEQQARAARQPGAATAKGL